MSAVKKKRVGAKGAEAGAGGGLQGGASGGLQGEDPYFSRAVWKALQILEVLVRGGKPVPLRQLTREVQLTKSSAFRLLHTLEALRYVQRDGEGRYSAVGRSGMGDAASRAEAVVRAAAEPMRQLNQKFCETVSLSVLLKNHMEVACVMESPHLVRMSNFVGRILPPHASSMGKAIAAHQPPELRRKLLQSYGLHAFTPSTLTEERLIEEQYEQVRRQGYAIDAEESTPGGHCFGVAIRSSQGQVEAAMSLSMPLARLPKGQAQRAMIQELRKAAEAIAQKLAAALES